MKIFAKVKGAFIRIPRAVSSLIGILYYCANTGSDTRQPTPNAQIQHEAVLVTPLIDALRAGMHSL